jgi:bacterioferritin-associated ferredoxin
MYVCHCMAVTDRAVDAAIDAGARTVDELTELCDAGGGCGGCHQMLQACLEAAGISADLVGASAA